MLFRAVLFVTCCTLAIAGCGSDGNDPGSDGGPDAGHDGGGPATDGGPDAGADGLVTTLVSAGPPAMSLPWATFEFTANEAAATFECKFDGGDFEACTSPKTYTELPDGAHSFEVRAVLGEAVDTTPATYNWTGGPFTYTTLSETGLYSDIASKTLAPDVIEFVPNHKLWSDGAIKRRWIRLPPGAQIDTSNFDRWEFPVGTQIWKEFRAPGGTYIETRLTERRASGGSPAGFEDYAVMTSFKWRIDESDADNLPAGENDVHGTDFDIPPADVCDQCHEGNPGLVLGFSAVQLARVGGPGETTLATLNADGLLSDPPSGIALGNIATPGAAGAEQNALGFFHANCGHCHNPIGNASSIDLDLMLRHDDTTVAGTGVFTTAVGVLVDNFPGWNLEGRDTRIVAGDANASVIPFRDGLRDARQMPPLATEIAPDLTDVINWINSL